MDADIVLLLLMTLLTMPILLNGWHRQERSVQLRLQLLVLLMPSQIPSWVTGSMFIALEPYYALAA
jgi:hypothetical protein